MTYFDQNMGVSYKNFALKRHRRGLRVPKSYLECSPEFKNGLGLEFGPKMSIL